MNQGEGLVLERKLESLGHEIVTSAEEAELVVLNTCTVIRPTETKILKRMEALSHEGKQLIVSGCMAAVQPEAIRRKIRDAIVIPPYEYDSFSRLVLDHFGEGDLREVRERRLTTAILPIAQGCLGSCSYCITRIARGRLRSYDFDSILQKAREFVESGSREILITAQDTGCYGLDIGRDVGQLTDAISRIPGKFRMRIGMMNPDSLAKVISSFLPAWSGEKVYKFLHLPVQSGSDRLIRAMGRRYSVEEFKSQVAAFREKCPDLTLSTDFITGFPGETGEDHRLSVELIEDLRPSIVNVTRFSPRPGTAAAEEKQVPSWISKERSRELTVLRFKISGSLNRGMEGRTEEVLVTERGKDGTFVGRTKSYMPVVLKEEVPIGNILEAKIVGSAPTHLIGKIIA